MILLAAVVVIMISGNPCEVEVGYVPMQRLGGFVTKDRVVMPESCRGDQSEVCTVQLEGLAKTVCVEKIIGSTRREYE